MSVPTWIEGRTGLVYAKKNASAYATAPSFASTNAVRHTAISLPFNPQNPRKSMARHAHPDTTGVFRGRAEASFELTVDLYPSGTLNTLPEADVLLAAIFGQAATNITLSTTFSGTPTTTTGTVASATGLAAGQFVRITLSADGSSHMRRLTPATSGTALVWAPPLPSAPASGDSCKGTITYSPANDDSPADLDIAHYQTGLIREQLGCLADQMVITLDSNLQPVVKFSGPAQGYAASPQSIPGAFTTVGSETGIPTGLFGYFQFGTALHEIEKLEATYKNNHDVHNTALGTDRANGAQRRGKREVSLKISEKVSSDQALWTPSITPGPSPIAENTVFLQLGTVAGSIWAFYWPRVIITQAPDTPDSDEFNNWDFNLWALGTNGNDVMYLGQG